MPPKSLVVITGGSSEVWAKKKAPMTRAANEAFRDEWVKRLFRLKVRFVILDIAQ